MYLFKSAEIFISFLASVFLAGVFVSIVLIFPFLIPILATPELPNYCFSESDIVNLQYEDDWTHYTFKKLTTNK